MTDAELDSLVDDWAESYGYDWQEDALAVLKIKLRTVRDSVVRLPSEEEVVQKFGDIAGFEWEQGHNSLLRECYRWILKRNT